MKRFWLVSLLALTVTGCFGSKNLDMAELKKVCNSIADPCEPCPPCPPVVPVPDPPKPEPPKPEPPDTDKGCDRDGLPPSGVFIWKPISDGDGKLAVITPADKTCERGVTVFYAKSKKSERGSSNGERANGCRLSWRFKKPGAEYGKGIRVVCYEADGNKVWDVPNGAVRVEKH